MQILEIAHRAGGRFNSKDRGLLGRNYLCWSLGQMTKITTRRGDTARPPATWGSRQPVTRCQLGMMYFRAPPQLAGASHLY